jgi:hypothetical protein
MRLVVQGAGGPVEILRVPMQWAAGEWHQVALIWSGKERVVLYLDGQAVAVGAGLDCNALNQLNGISGFCLGSDVGGNQLAQLATLVGPRQFVGGVTFPLKPGLPKAAWLDFSCPFLTLVHPASFVRISVRRPAFAKQPPTQFLLIDKLLWLLPARGGAEFRLQLNWALEEATAQDQLKREPKWTESLAGEVRSSWKRSRTKCGIDRRQNPVRRTGYGSWRKIMGRFSGPKTRP